MPDTSADDQSDYEIREAIAASLEGMNCPTRNQGDIVDLTGDTDDDEVVPIHPKSKSAIEVDIDDDATGGSDEYDEDLQRAIELSKQDLEHDEEDSLEAHNISASQPHDSKPGSSRKDITLPQEQNIPQPLGVLGLDRMKMEQERLARLAKRKSEHATLIDERETKQLKTETPLNLHVKQDVNSLTTTKNEPSNLGDAGPTGSNKELTALTPSSRPSVQFPSGVVKKTWVYSCSRLGDDIKIEEVLQKGDLDLAVLSSFMWDMEWLFSKLDTKNTRLLLMMQAKDESTVGL
ncbi:hypothetical protein EYZ11_008527 [Aspergillus tanneri]|uniref:Uncharacterized protein n=1 Tax=Aspergillus tanneri TaxID=1220188 RepID=A0A4S3JCD7_9EURO|nr:hypothetical protein EYZ11_008527 [Aspergillus tanneri]